MNISAIKFETPDIRDIIGDEEYNDLLATAEGLTLSGCPFCGGEATARIGTTWTIPTVSVFCTSCGCMTPRGWTGGKINGGTYSLPEKLTESAAIWNRRAEI